MAPTPDFRHILIGLWLRLVTIGLVGLPIAAMPKVLEKAGGWLFYQTGGEVVFEVSAYLVFVALCGVAFGTLCTAIIAPFLSRKQSRAHIAEIATKVGVAAIAFIDFRILVGVLMVHSGLRSPRIINAVFDLYYLAFAVVLLISRQRKRLVESLDDVLEEKTTRRTVIGLGVASVRTAHQNLSRITDRARGEIERLRSAAVSSYRGDRSTELQGCTTQGRKNRRAGFGA